MTEVDRWWDAQYRWTKAEIEAHGGVATEDIEEVDYEAPYPVREKVPCYTCRGQGFTTLQTTNYDNTPRDSYSVTGCNTCKGTAEIEFECESCGTRNQLTPPDGNTIPWHKQWCPECDICMSTTSGGKVCCRPIVERFDVRADGHMWGYCGVHARGKGEEEENAKIRKEDSEIWEWEQEEKEREKRGVTDRILAVAAELGMPNGDIFDYNENYKGEVTVKISLEVLEIFLGLSTVEDVMEPPIELAEGVANDNPF